MLLAFAVVLVTFASRPVDAATCSNLTSLKCEDTDFTETECGADNVCGCNDGFPIPSGCSKKLNKPNVTLSDSSRTSIIVPGANAVLVCSTMANKADVTFAWSLNNEVLTGENKEEYNIVAADTSKVGLYSCQLKVGEYNASDESDPLEVTLLTSSSNFSLTVTDVPTSAAAGSTYNATCMGLPVGANATFNLTGVKPLVNPISVDDAGNISCSYNGVVSDPVITPAIVDDITNVEIKVEGAVGAEFIYKTGTNVTLSCLSEPLDIYMNVGSAIVEYNFTDVTTFDTTIGQTYIPESTGNHTIFCSASYNSSTSKTSARVSVVFMDNYITSTLNAFGTELIEGSRLVLMCSSVPGVTYTWIKDNNHISLQYDRTIQVDSITESDAGNYSCSAQKANYIAQSNTVKISIVDEIRKPTIFRTDGEKDFYEEESYQLECRTASATAGMVYTWEWNDAIIPNVLDRFYSLTNVVASKVNGNYTCQVTFKNITSVQSALFLVVAENAVPGKPCSITTAKTDCPKPAYTEVCKKDKVFRCQCAAGYRVNQKVCQKSSALASSVIVVLIGVLFSRMM